MSLFRISEAGLIPFHLVAGESMGGEQADHDLAQALWSDLDAISGQRLFPVRRGEVGDDSPPPVTLALDATGGLVLLYARALIGSTQLAECLEQLGWARSITVGELSSIYWRGADNFWEDWEDFSGTPTPAALSEGSGQPRVMFVSTKIAASTESALRFLADTGVPVSILRAALYSDDHGCQLLELRDVQHSGPVERDSEPARSANDTASPASQVSPNGNGRNAPATMDEPKSSGPTSASRMAQNLRRSLEREGRNIDVGGMTRVAADELFAGSDREPAGTERQSRFARPSLRKPPGSQAQPGSVSPFRRRLSPADEPGPSDTLDRDLAELTGGGRRDDRDASPQLAPLRFTSELVEPQLPAELMEPRSISDLSDRNYG